jgi:AsmA protein
MAETKHRGLRIALVILAVLIVVPVAAAALLALTFDANRLKPRLVTAIEQATGRSVTIAGNISLGLSLQPTLEVNNVSLGNGPGFAPTSMATLDRLDLRLALLPLLHRQVEIEQLDLVHPVIGLQIDAQGRDNWHFAPPPAPSPNIPQTPSRGGPRTTLRIKALSIQYGAITFADARTGAAFGANAVQLKATQDDPDGPIRLDLTGTDRDMPIAVSGDVGRPQDQFMRIALTLKAAGASLAVKGIAPAFAVSGIIPDLAALSPLAGTALPALHDISIQTNVAPPQGGTYANGIVLTALHVGAPTGDLGGDATVTLAAPLAVRAVLKGTNVDPAALMAALPAPPRAAPSPAVSNAAPPAAAPTMPPAGTAQAPGALAPMLISDRPLPFGDLPRIDADVRLTLQDTKVGSGKIALLSTHAVLHAGHLVLDPLAIDMPGGHVDATVMADASGAAALMVRAPALSIQPMLSAFNEPDGVLGTLEVKADLRGTGTTPRALASSLDGKAGLALANGEIDNRLLVAMLSRIAPEAGFLDLSGKAGRSALRCVAVRADLAHGVADLRALLLDTVPLRLTGGGTIDLGQETLALRLLPLARIGATGLSVPVNIRGTLRAPKAAVDTAGNGKGLGGIVMGALGADRLIAGAGQKDGCAEQLQLARFGDPGPLPAALPEQGAAKAPAQNLNNLLKQLLR